MIEGKDHKALMDVIAQARAHSLALEQIPGLRLARVLLHPENELLSTTIHCCVGSCTKCDSYWRTFRVSPYLVIEVVEVGYSEAAAPA